MFKNVKRGLGNYKKDYGSNEIYNFYKKEVIPELQVDKQTFREVCDEFNKIIINSVVASNIPFPGMSFSSSTRM